MTQQRKFLLHLRHLHLRDHHYHCLFHHFHHHHYTILHAQPSIIHQENLPKNHFDQHHNHLHHRHHLNSCHLFYLSVPLNPSSPAIGIFDRGIVACRQFEMT